MATVTNVTRGAVLAAAATTARAPWTRLIGLMGRRHLPSGAGLVFPGVQSIHTHFMRFPIDVVFYGKDHVVMDVLHSLPPWKLSSHHWRAKGVVELPAGVLLATGTLPGDVLAIT